MAYKKVYLKPGKEESLKRFHPWVFSGAIHHIEGEPEEGEIVDVYTSKKEFIACGHFQIGSIAVRVLTFRQKEIDHDFWKHRLEVAYDLRRSLGLAGNPINNTYRLVHGEGDNLPGLIIDALESGNGEYLKKWADELQAKKINVVNMLGCHDGIPLLDLRGLLPEERIQSLIDIIVKRGGYVKDLHGEKKVYYQVNATYYSALGENDKKMLLARAIQMFMPGKPQVWYLDLFAGKNDYQAVADAGDGGHKEINRTNLSMDEIKERLKWEVVQKQLELMRLRNSHPAFSETSQMTFLVQNNQIHIMWKKDQFKLTLEADLKTLEWKIY